MWALFIMKTAILVFDRFPRFMWFGEWQGHHRRTQLFNIFEKNREVLSLYLSCSPHEVERRWNVTTERLGTESGTAWNGRWNGRDREEGGVYYFSVVYGLLLNLCHSTRSSGTFIGLDYSKNKLPSNALLCTIINYSLKHLLNCNSRNSWLISNT